MQPRPTLMIHPTVLIPSLMVIPGKSYLGWVAIRAQTASSSWTTHQYIMEVISSWCVTRKVGPHLCFGLCWKGAQMFSPALRARPIWSCSTGVLLLYLPPYCPELNPIELAFGILKNTLKQSQLLVTHHLNPISHIKKMAVRILTHRLSCKIYAKCGYNKYSPE